MSLLFFDKLTCFYLLYTILLIYLFYYCNVKVCKLKKEGIIHQSTCICTLISVEDFYILLQKCEKIPYVIYFNKA